MKTNLTASIVLLALLASCLLFVGCKDSYYKPSNEGKYYTPQNEEKVVSYDNDPTADPSIAQWTSPRQAGGHNQTLSNVDDETGAVHYGANVYYFPRIEYAFANGLATFLLTHTNLEVTAIAPNVIRMNSEHRKTSDINYHYHGDYGAAVGYFVTFRQK